MAQHGLPMKTLCMMKETRHIRSHIVRFHLYEMFVIGKPHRDKTTLVNVGAGRKQKEE